MTTTTKPTMRPEALEAFRYRRKLLRERRTRIYAKAAREVADTGTPHGRTEQLIRKIEREVREYNEVANEYDLPQIRG